MTNHPNRSCRRYRVKATFRNGDGSDDVGYWSPTFRAWMGDEETAGSYGRHEGERVRAGFAKSKGNFAKVQLEEIK